MRVICISNMSGTSTLALTVNNQYEVVRETRDFYIVVNDNNVEQRYGKTKFTIVPEGNAPQAPAAQPTGNRVSNRAAAQPTPPAPTRARPAVVRKTDQEIIDTVRVNIVNSNNTTSVTVSYNAAQNQGDPENIKTKQCSYQIMGSGISCGVYQLTNLNSLSRILENVTGFIDYQERDYEGLIPAIYAKIGRAMVDHHRSNFGIIVASDVHSTTKQQALERMGFAMSGGTTAYNPNSSNTIAVYTKVVRARR